MKLATVTSCKTSSDTQKILNYVAKNIIHHTHCKYTYAWSMWWNLWIGVSIFFDHPFNCGLSLIEYTIKYSIW